MAEPGSETVREVYLQAYSKDAIISFSLWNVGEFLGLIDRAERLGRITDLELVRKRFLRETERMVRLGIARMVPMRVQIMRESWG